MLYVFCGDRYSSREHARAFVDACKKKRSDAEYVLVTESTEEPLQNILYLKSLFGTKYIIFCDELLKTNKHGPNVYENLKEYINSPHMFVLFEPEFNTKDEKTFEKEGVKVTRCEENIYQTEDPKAMFAFADLFLKGDKQKTLVMLHKLVQEHHSSASLLNILIWQVRVLCLVSNADTAKDAGVKPFLFTKSKGVLKKVTNPLSLFLKIEKIIREKRLQGAVDEEILEYIILSV